MKNSNRQEIRFLHEGTSVKNAKLVYTETDKTYRLVHYDTVILEISKDLEVIKALKCSQSSSRAIRQVAHFLGLNYYTDIKPKMETFTNFSKYTQGHRTYLKQEHFKSVANNEFQPITRSKEATVYSLPQKMIKGCPNVIFDPTHYYNDGSCQCYHKEVDMSVDGYKWNQKKGVWN